MAFKKPLHDLKTSAPLRSSDRRKLRTRVTEQFSISVDAADILVPEGLQSVKFSTHLDEPGIVYLSPEGGNPLWFTLGKGSDVLIPTVYSLWKNATLIPSLFTPAQVVPILTGGADLMCPGVILESCPVELLKKGSLVCIIPHGQNTAAAVAVGIMALNGHEIRPGMKGKAVHLLHAYGDHLWEMGTKGELPGVQFATPLQPSEDLSPPTATAGASGSTLPAEAALIEPLNPAPPEVVEDIASSGLSPTDVDAILRRSLVQAIFAHLSRLPASSFPIPASSFYSGFILPARPQHPEYPTPIDIKHSSYKNLTAFLKAAKKDGLLDLKEIKGETYVTGVVATHDDVVSHRTYRTLGDVEQKHAKAAKDVEAERNKVKPMVVTELFKPAGPTVSLFQIVEKDIAALYTAADLRAILNEYIAVQKLGNPHHQQYFTPDTTLLLALTKKDDSIEFLKRDEGLQKLSDNMQAWYSVTAEGKDPVVRKGQLKPISVITKFRQGKRPSTAITGFEPFFLSADFLCEELKRICASATSVSLLPGKAAGKEVLVQGKQIKPVTELLLAQGVPKKWIESTDST